MLKGIIKRFGYTAYYWSTQMAQNRSSAIPKVIEGFEGRIKKIVMGDNHNAIITDDNQLYTWGSNKQGQLGHKTAQKKYDEPTLVEFFERKNIKIVDVKIGRSHTIALTSNGVIFSWGKGKLTSNFITSLLYPNCSALGHPEVRNYAYPKAIVTLKDVYIDQISTGNDFAMALSKAGQVWVWGRGEFGVLGMSNRQQKVPIVNTTLHAISQQSNNSKPIKIESCGDFSSVLFSNGKVYSFGNNDQGNLGIGVTQSVDTCDSIVDPTECQFEDDRFIKFKDISLGECQTAYLSEDNKVYFCGRKLVYKPKLFEIDYDQNKVKSFCATDKGVALITYDNKIFYQGNFWKTKYINENISTGVREIDTAQYFDNKKIFQIGGQYVTKYALVEENKNENQIQNFIIYLDLYQQQDICYINLQIFIQLLQITQQYPLNHLLVLQSISYQQFLQMLLYYFLMYQNQLQQQMVYPFHQFLNIFYLQHLNHNHFYT